MIIWDWACNQLTGLPPKQWTSRKRSQDCKELNQESQLASGANNFLSLLSWRNTPMEGLIWAPCQLSVCLGDISEPTFKELSPLVKGETVRVIPLPRDKSQTWFKAEIEELADVWSYCTCIKCRQKMGESSAETADISAGAESHSTAHNLERLL